MALKIKYEKGTPPHKGYYLVRLNPEYGFNMEKDKYPETMYWNGKEWQDKSDEDAFKMPGNNKPITLHADMYEGWCEL